MRHLRIHLRLTPEVVSEREDVLERSLLFDLQPLPHGLIVAPAEGKLCFEVGQPLLRGPVQLGEKPELPGLLTEFLGLLGEAGKLVFADRPGEFLAAFFEPFLLNTANGFAGSFHAGRERGRQFRLQILDVLLERVVDLIPDVAGFGAIARGRWFTPLAGRTMR